MPRTTASVLLVTLLGGCFANPARNTTPTGEPLRVRFDLKTGTYQTQEVVGQSNFYDADGNSTGSVERTRTVNKQWSRTDTSFYQGDAKIDEQDYYLLAKAPGAVDEIKEARAQMSRDLTIGFPLAIGASTASTLFAIGTFGDSAALRYGASTLASVVALGGVLLALRGLKIYQRRPLLERERAIKHAHVVELCARGRCSTEQGGAQTEPAPPSLKMRAPAPAPAKTAPAWSGTWKGTGTSALTRRGQTQEEKTAYELAIEEHPDDRLTLTFETTPGRRCSLTARVSGDRAELAAGQRCEMSRAKIDVVLTIRDGSSLTLRDGQLAFSLDLDVAETDRRGRTPRATRMVGSMAATTTRAP